MGFAGVVSFGVVGVVPPELGAAGVDPAEGVVDGLEDEDAVLDAALADDACLRFRQRRERVVRDAVMLLGGAFGGLGDRLVRVRRRLADGDVADRGGCAGETDAVTGVGVAEEPPPSTA